MIFIDLFKISVEGSLKRLGELLSLAKHVRGGMQKDLPMPYMHFTTMGVLDTSEVPERNHPSWRSMRDGKPTCTEEEHAALAERVGRDGWRSVFETYLKAVSCPFYSPPTVPLRRPPPCRTAT